MRTIGSWWSRCRTRAALAKLGVTLAVLAVFGHTGVLHHLAGVTGSIWS